MSQKYQLIINNDTQNPGNLCCFQQPSSPDMTEALPLAWIVQPVSPGSPNTFEWETDYNFVWGQPGSLTAGNIFTASQTIDAGLVNNNNIQFGYDNNAYQFSGQTTQSPAGSLTIQMDSTVPQAGASVGVGMNGVGIFALWAMPNFSYRFSPETTYWLAFGNYNEGEVLDPITMTGIVEVTFPAGVYTLYAMLHKDNTLTISTTPQGI